MQSERALFDSSVLNWWRHTQSHEVVIFVFWRKLPGSLNSLQIFNFQRKTIFFCTTEHIKDLYLYFHNIAHIFKVADNDTSSVCELWRIYTRSVNIRHSLTAQHFTNGFGYQLQVLLAIYNLLQIGSNIFNSRFFFIVCTVMRWGW